MNLMKFKGADDAAKSLLSTSTGKYMRQATYRPVICGNTNT